LIGVGFFIGLRMRQGPTRGASLELVVASATQPFGRLPSLLEQKPVFLDIADTHAELHAHGRLIVHVAGREGKG
jgi:hypothetical protein